MSAPASFFIPEADRFRATEWTRGPWSPDHQHGGPPSALLARSIERATLAHGPFQIARITVDLLRPIPISVFSIQTAVVRPGRRVITMTAALVHDGKEVCRALATCIRAGVVDLPAVGDRWPEHGAVPPPPASGRPFEFPFFEQQVGYHKAVEIQVVDGTFGSGRLTAWMRSRLALVPGEPLSPVQRVMLFADSGNGLSAAYDWKAFTFINPDLTVHLHRLPESDWIGLSASTTAHDTGIGTAECALSDEKGPLGRSVQSLIVERRAGA